MNEFIKSAFAALPSAAASPAAFVAYIAVLIAWIVIGLKIKRNLQVLQHIRDLPARDRLQALREEMGTAPLSEGLSPEQFLRSHIHRYLFLAFLALLVVVVILVVVARTDPRPKRQSVEIDITPYSRPDATHDNAGPPPASKVYFIPSDSANNDVDEYAKEYTTSRCQYSRVSEAMFLSSNTPYTEKLRGSTDAVTLPESEFDWFPPELAIKISNNTDKTILISEIVINVNSAIRSDEPVLRMHVPWGDGDSGFFELINDGWGPVLDADLEFQIKEPKETKPGKNQNEVYRARLGSFDKEASVQIGKYVPEKVIEGIVDRHRLMLAELKAREPNSFGFGPSVSLVGKVKYRTRSNDKRIASFETDVPLYSSSSFYSIVFPSAYYGVEIDPDERVPSHRIPLTHTVKPGDTDLLVVVLKPMKSSVIDLTISVLDARREELKRQRIALDAFVPRTSLRIRGLWNSVPFSKLRWTWKEIPRGRSRRPK